MGNPRTRTARRLSSLRASSGIAALALACLFATDASAQQQLRQRQDSTTIDWSVIDQLARGETPGTAATRPGAGSRPPAKPNGTKPAPTKAAAGKPARTAEPTPPQQPVVLRQPAPTPPDATGVSRSAPPPRATAAAPATPAPEPAFRPPVAPPVFQSQPQPPPAPVQVSPTPPTPSIMAPTPAAPAPAVVPLPAPAPVTAASAPPSVASPPAPPAAAAPPVAAPPIAVPPIPAQAPRAAAGSATPPPVAAPAPANSSAAAPAPAPQIQASLPNRADAAAASARLGFANDSAELPAEARAQLRGVIDKLRRGQDARLRIEGFASGEDANRARRLSLSRALAVRAFLMDEGLSSTRMDVYARGSQAEGGPSDRVDLNVFRR